MKIPNGLYRVSTPTAVFGIEVCNGVVCKSAPIASRQVMGRNANEAFHMLRTRWRAQIERTNYKPAGGSQ